MLFATVDSILSHRKGSRVGSPPSMSISGIPKADMLAINFRYCCASTFPLAAIPRLKQNVQASLHRKVGKNWMERNRCSICSLA